MAKIDTIAMMWSITIVVFAVSVTLYFDSQPVKITNTPLVESIPAEAENVAPMDTADSADQQSRSQVGGVMQQTHSTQAQLSNELADKMKKSKMTQLKLPQICSNNIPINSTDADADGLLDLLEPGYGTDPTKLDTDADGISDKDEICKPPFSKPNDDDSDDDGIKDGQDQCIMNAETVNNYLDTDGCSDTAPDTIITSSPPSLSLSQAQFSFITDSPDPSLRFQCKIDIFSWQSCTSSKVVYLTNGPHTFKVRVVTQNLAYQDLTPASYTWTVDGIVPNTTITSNPASTSPSTTASFTFTSNETPSAFECKIDTGSWQPCTSSQSYTDLTHGSHTFSVRAKDSVGNTDSTPASYTWNVHLDVDNDTILDSIDNCPEVANTNQLNTDGDSMGNACDTNDDNDTILDSTDSCPLQAETVNGYQDTDGCPDVLSVKPTQTNFCPPSSSTTSAGTIVSLTISGCKFNDFNNDKRYTPGESPIANWPIYLYEKGLGQAATFMQTVNTDANGNYKFTISNPNLWYLVCEDSKQGWQQTFPYVSSPTDVEDADNSCKTINPNHESNGYYLDGLETAAFANTLWFDFGNTSSGSDSDNDSYPDSLEQQYNTDPNNSSSYPKITISGTKWNDEDADGIKDSTESPLADWTIRAKHFSGTVAVSDVTDSNGNYEIIIPLPTDGWGLLTCERIIDHPGWTQIYPKILIPNNNNLGNRVFAVEECSILSDYASTGYRILPTNNLYPTLLNNFDFGNDLTP